MPMKKVKVPCQMIELTRLNGTRFALNCDLIKIVEASPDTMLTLINGEKLIVREGLEDVQERIVAYKARLLTESQQTSQLTGNLSGSRVRHSSILTGDQGDEKGLDA